MASEEPVSASASALMSTSKRQQIDSLSILLQISMLGLAFVFGHILRRHKFYYLHEGSASLLIGLVVGALARFTYPQDRFSNWFNFHEGFFFLFLLPPIIFDSGFNLQPGPFFSNFGAICTFAILGTLISAMVTGGFVYLGGRLSLVYKLPLLESCIFGSIISATDPVSVLAVFQELGTDVNLYALVLGESVLNDAVAVSLYRSLVSVRQNLSASYNVTIAIIRFFITFLGSLFSEPQILAGILHYRSFGGASLRIVIQVCRIARSQIAAPRMLPDRAISILCVHVCGRFRPLRNCCDTPLRHLSLAETFVFMYMGVDIANERHSNWLHISFILFSVVILVVARAINVYPLAYCINKLRSASRKIPIQHQNALWFSGLRGAMAFALALQSVHNFQDSHGQVIFTTTTTIVILTVLVIGGSTSTMLENLNLNKEKDEYSKVSIVEDEQESMLNTSNEEFAANSTRNHDLKSKFHILRKSTSFKEIDMKILKPFFTTSKSDSMLGLHTEDFLQYHTEGRNNAKLGHAKSDTAMVLN
ncbi:sodium/hydrogen exchanger 5 isoform X2 [Physcomitrium patens]|uniref:sodium/hydrogen exchanger 5 isoform X2 n=1 Tax=Physcomitrium patens TaxID=3218 RepID=UPI003CCCF593